MKKYIILLLIFSLLFSFSLQAQKKVYATSFGLVPDNGKDGTEAFIKIFDAIKDEPEVQLIISAGTYHFYEENSFKKIYYESNTTNTGPKNLSILMKNLQNVHVEGNFAQFIFHGKVQPLTIENCKNIKIRNLFIDFATPTSAEGEIIDVKNDHFVLKIDTTQYSYTIQNKKIKFYIGKHLNQPYSFIEFNTKHNIVEPYSGDRGWDNFDVVEDSIGVLKIFTSNTQILPKKGNWIVIRYGERTHAGVFILNSSDITMQNLNIYQSDGLGILSQNSKNVNFYSCSIVPNTSINRKYFSSHDDGFHFMGCSGLIQMDNCETYGLMDDAVNIHGIYTQITKISKNKIKAQFMHPQSTGLEWGRVGETVAFVDHKSMVTLSTGIIKKYKKLNVNEFEITFETDVPSSLTKGMVIENLTCYPDVMIRNSRFRSGRARGLLLSTQGKILIESNIFETSGSAILIAGDANNWFESGPVNNVLIKNNIFRYSCLTSLYQYCEAVISIYPEIPELEPDYPYHTNIRIEKNNFFLFDYPILFAKSVNGIYFINNTLYRSNDFQPFHYNKFGVKLIGCKNAFIGNNQEIGDILGKTVIIEQMEPGEVNKKQK
jgi:hypothetical protein